MQDQLGNRWFLTGDLARMDPQTGYVTLLGRRHELIISGGLNIYPREVEEMLTTFPGIEEAAVVGERDAVWGEVTVAYLVCSCAIDEAELERLLPQPAGLLQTPAPPAHRRRPAPQRHGQDPKASPPAQRLGRGDIGKARFAELRTSYCVFRAARRGLPACPLLEFQDEIERVRELRTRD